MIVIDPPKSLSGTLRVPGDKSISHRSIMLGAIAEGDTAVRGFLRSADCLATMDCFRRMGVRIEERTDSGPSSEGRSDESVLVIHGRGLHGLTGADGLLLDAKNSGTTVRLMSGILAGQPFMSRITGDASLSSRPMGRIIRPLEQMGIRCVSEHGDGRLPISVYGGRPKAIRYASPIASAQVKSCVLLAGLYADDPTFYTEPVLSRNHTELMLGAFGGNLKTRIQADGSATTILYPGTILKGQSVTVPGDISSAAYFLAAGLLVRDARVTLTHVGINETRDGILRVIQAMGGDLTIRNVRIEGREPVADLTVSSSKLHGTVIGGSLIPTLIDELPVIAVMAAQAEGDTVIRDAGEMRVKESDRLAAITKNLRSMGIAVEETPDGMTIHGGRLKGARIDPLGDHRLAMAFTVAGLVSSTPTVILDESCVRISYPSFFEDLRSLT